MGTMDHASAASLIRLGRAARGWSQRELAAAANVSSAKIWRIENNVGRAPADELHRLAATLGLPPLTHTLVVELAAAAHPAGIPPRSGRRRGPTPPKAAPAAS